MYNSLPIDDWFDENEVPFSEPINDQQCSRLFASITYTERLSFFRQWVKLRSEREYIAYDVTSVSTYSQGIDWAEWGYNRDYDNLPQINIGMFFGSESRLPVYYNVYSGSITDKSHLKFMMDGAEELGINCVRFVMDRGFVTEDNLLYMAEKELLFVTAFPGNLLEAKRIIDENRGNIRKAINRLSQFDVYAATTDVNLYGLGLKAHIYFDAEKQVMDEKELYAHIDRLEAELVKLGRGKRASKRFTDFFTITQEKSDMFSYTPNNEKIDERLGRAGFFILLSNDPNLTSGELLGIYRGKDVIEKSFDQFKNGLDFKRLRTHFNDTTEGKVFVGFIALILRSYLLSRIKDNPDTKQLTLEKVLLECRKIRAVSLNNLSRMLMPLTKIQRTILEAIGVSSSNIMELFA